MDKERILVIDDDMYMRNACERFLKKKEYSVTTAESGEDGIQRLDESPFELVITDFKMGKIDGLAVLRHVKSHYPKTDVIVITAHGTIENAVEAMRQGAYDYLSKNFDLTELELIVKRCIERQRLSAEVSELKELVNLYEVSKAMSSLMDIDELLRLILSLVSDTLAADGGSVMLFDPQTNELVVKVALGARAQELIGKRVPLGERISGYAAQKEHLVLIQGPLKNDPRFAHIDGFDAITSSITAPLQRKGKLLGVINMHRRNNDTQFNERDEHLLSIFAVEAAIAIENTSLFNALAQEKEALAQEKEELSATFASMGNGAIITDIGMKIVRLNASAEALLGISQKERGGSYLPEAVADFEPSVPWADIESASERTVSFELERKKGKSLILGVLATKIFSSADALSGYIIVLRDITDEKKEEKYKMNFLSIISHKLKTPLTTINGFSSFFAEKMQESDQKLAAALASISKQGRLLNDLVDSLLRFTLLESEYNAILQERASAQGMASICSEGLSDLLVHSNAELIIDPSIERLPPLWVDHVKMVEVLQNLIENGVKFNDKESKRVTMSGETLENGYVVLRIVDNGLGIPSEETAKIFKKFYQIDEYSTGQVRGMGLGLALVKKIVEMHGGEVTVESVLGQGSTFSLTLPVYTNQSKQ